MNIAALGHLAERAPDGHTIDLGYSALISDRHEQNALNERIGHYEHLER